MRVRTVAVTRKRRKKVLKAARGYWGGKHRLFKTAKETVNKGRMYASRDRRTKKRNMRKLWMIRIGAGTQAHQFSYSQFMHGLKNAKIKLNRKMLAEIAVLDSKTFNQLIKTAKAN